MNELATPIADHLRDSKNWLNGGNCCGQHDHEGRCAAPACIFGDSLKWFFAAADEIDRQSKIRGEAEKMLREAEDRIEEANAIVFANRAARDVILERRRQVESEGWTAWSEDIHAGGDLARCAASYAINSTQYPKIKGAPIPGPWPWSRGLFRPQDRRSDLVKAGALILAEIDRLDRAAAKETTDVR